MTLTSQYNTIEQAVNNGELKKLEDDLWDAANSLRAYGGIKASDYAVPVLGLIFLRFAENKYSQVESEIIKEFANDKGTRLERPIENIAIEKCGFYLPQKARYDYLLNLPGAIKTAQAIKEAMEAIEEYQNPGFKGVLPKDPYFEIEKKKEDILPQLLKTFSDIPLNASGDVFGKIYEYFLGKFALSEGQKGGEFFTPTSVVRFIVETIEPFQGMIFDPACGSGGMFVQSANFLSEVQQDRSKIYVEGQEFMGETVRLAKMNLMVNNLRGEIAEVNSYETDQFGSLGKYDYVMANPPFNVKGIQESTVKNDKRFTTYGLPKPKGKKEDKITDANYLWISLFATSLNDLTNKEKKQVKLAAQSLLKKLKNAKDTVLIEKWYKELQSQARVRREIQVVLSNTLPESYDQDLFDEKINVIFQHLYKQAERGMVAQA